MTGFARRSWRCSCGSRSAWTVDVREANYSAFNGYRRTPSAYSQVRCAGCGSVWRTKAKYVATLPDSTSVSRGESA